MSTPRTRLSTAPQPSSGWLRWLPGLQQLRGYRAEWLRHDLAAGLVLTTMLVPVGVAYAVASGVPGINGLYATIAALLAYALFGPSRILVLGPDAALAALILAVVLPLSGGDPARAVAVAAMMALAVGLVCIAGGLARLGFFTDLLSKPIRYGYMNGIAIVVLISQTAKLFGLSAGDGSPPEQAIAFARGLLAGQAQLVTLAIGAAALALILGLKRWPRVPGMLVAVIAATAAVGLFELDTRAGVKVLGTLPQGLPALVWPAIGWSDLAPIVTGALAVAMVAFADASVLSRAFALRSGQRVDTNQELLGIGAANLACGLFQGFPINASSSRTPVAEAAGSKSQLTGVVGALAVAALLMAAPTLLRHLPDSALAAVVIASVVGLIEWRDLLRIRRIQAWEFWLSIGCSVGVIVFGAIQGIALAVIVAVIEFLWDGWRPHSTVLGKVEGVAGYHDIARHPEAVRDTGLVLFRWDAPLFFANAELFQQRVLDAVDTAPTPPRWVVVAAEPVTSVDVTAGDMLAELDQTLQDAGIELCFAEMKGPVKDKLRRFGLFSRFGHEAFHPTVDAAVDAYRVLVQAPGDPAAI